MIHAVAKDAGGDVCYFDCCNASNHIDAYICNLESYGTGAAGVAN